MDFKVLVLVLVFGMVIGCFGHSLKFGKCPKVKVMKDFDMNKFLGEWFVIGRYHPLASCTKVFIDKTPEGYFTAKESSRPLGLDLGLDQYRQPRKLVILKNDTDAIFKMSHTFSYIGSNTYGMVDTDYETYAIVWSCDPVLMGSVQNLDILSRTPDSDINFDVMKNAKDSAARQGIDVQSVGKVEHANCLSSKEDGPNMVVVPEEKVEVE